MKSLIIILIVFLSGCTTIYYNADTKEFRYTSTKECEKCEVTYKKDKDGVKMEIKIGSLKAFAGQKALFDSVTHTIDSMTGMGLIDAIAK